MKRAAIALGALLLLIAGASGMLLRLHSLSDGLMDEVQALTTAAVEQPELTPERYRALAERWADFEPRLVPMVGRVHTDSIDVSVERIGWRVDDGDMGELLVELGELAAHIDRMWRSEALLVENLL